VAPSTASGPTTTEEHVTGEDATITNEPGLTKTTTAIISSTTENPTTTSYTSIASTTYTETPSTTSDSDTTTDFTGTTPNSPNTTNNPLPEVDDYYSFWNAFTIAMVVVLSLIALILIAFFFYRLGKSRRKEVPHELFVDYDNLPKPLVMPRVTKVYPNPIRITGRQYPI
ncbi:jg25112, partial [Pararge aegeria aegeria]